MLRKLLVALGLVAAIVVPASVAGAAPPITVTPPCVGIDTAGVGHGWGFNRSPGAPIATLRFPNARGFVIGTVRGGFVQMGNPRGASGEADMGGQLHFAAALAPITMVASMRGTMNFNTGLYSAVGIIYSSTGLPAGTNGQISVSGTFNLNLSGDFTVVVHFSLCNQLLFAKLTGGGGGVTGV